MFLVIRIWKVLFVVLVVFEVVLVIICLILLCLDGKYLNLKYWMLNEDIILLMVKFGVMLKLFLFLCCLFCILKLGIFLFFLWYCLNIWINIMLFGNVDINFICFMWVYFLNFREYVDVDIDVMFFFIFDFDFICMID